MTYNCELNARRCTDRRFVSRFLFTREGEGEGFRDVIAAGKARVVDLFWLWGLVEIL